MSLKEAKSQRLAIRAQPQLFCIWLHLLGCHFGVGSKWCILESWQSKKVSLKVCPALYYMMLVIFKYYISISPLPMMEFKVVDKKRKSASRRSPIQAGTRLRPASLQHKGCFPCLWTLLFSTESAPPGPSPHLGVQQQV